MYCKKEDVYAQMEQRIVKSFAMNSGETGNEWEARLENMIAQATEEINSYIRGRYQTPLSPVPGFVKDLCVRIVKYKLISRKGYAPNSPEEGIAKDYQGVIKTLEKIRDGHVDIGISLSETESTPSPKAIYKTERKIFGNKDFWKGF